LGPDHAAPPHGSHNSLTASYGHICWTRAVLCHLQLVLLLLCMHLPDTGDTSDTGVTSGVTGILCLPPLPGPVLARPAPAFCKDVQASHLWLHTVPRSGRRHAACAAVQRHERQPPRTRAAAAATGAAAAGTRPCIWNRCVGTTDGLPAALASLMANALQVLHANHGSCGNHHVQGARPVCTVHVCGYILCGCLRHHSAAACERLLESYHQRQPLPSMLMSDMAKRCICYMIALQVFVCCGYWGCCCSLSCSLPRLVLSIPAAYP